MQLSDTDNFSEDDLCDYDNAVYVSLPGADVGSEDESVCWYQNVAAKRKYSYRRDRLAKTKQSHRTIIKRSPPRQSNKRQKVSPTKSRDTKCVPKKKTSASCKSAINMRHPKVNIKKNRWINGDFEKTTKFPKRSKDFGKYSGLSPTELFELFFTDDVWEHIQTETSKYALSINCADPKITKSELKCFFGILIVSGYNILPGKKFYWDSASDMRNEFVSDSMRRERFITIMKFMHWADNSQMSSEDKVWKIRPVIDMLQAKFLENFVPTEHLNYDESMIMALR